MPTREQLRKTLLQRRNRCSRAECLQLSAQICTQLRHSKLFVNRERLALYYSVANEVDLTPLFGYGWSLNKKIFLPVLCHFPKGQLWWVQYNRDTPMYLNKFNIPEPDHHARARSTKTQSLDVIFMPLVGFDRHGNRLGMGGGFYDRSLARCFHPAKTWARPLRVGVAYSCQQVEHIPNEKWDIPLDAVVTEHGIQWFV